jgi:hypothetical protein
MRQPVTPPRESHTAQRFLLGLRLAALLIAAVVLVTLSLPNLLRHLPIYQPAWAQIAAFGTYLTILGVEAVLAARRRGWGQLRWVGLTATIIASLGSCLSLPAGSAASLADWSFGSVGWLGVILLADRRLRELVAFLALHETLTLVNVILSGGTDRTTVLSTLAVSVNTIGYPLAGAIAAIALRVIAHAADTAAHQAEQARSAEAIAAGLHERRRQRFADLNDTAVPLLRGLAAGTLDPGDAQVQRRCAIEAARMRRLFAETETTPDPLMHALRHCADAAYRQGILVELDSRGRWPDPPEEIRRALTEAPVTALATAKSWARVTVIGTAELLSVNVIADCGPIDLPQAFPTGVELQTITDHDTLWVEVRWATTPSPQ